MKIPILCLSGAIQCIFSQLVGILAWSCGSFPLKYYWTSLEYAEERKDGQDLSKEYVTSDTLRETQLPLLFLQHPIQSLAAPSTGNITFFVLNLPDLCCSLAHHKVPQMMPDTYERLSESHPLCLKNHFVLEYRIYKKLSFSSFKKMAFRVKWI